MTHLDLFSGIGGFALAAQWAGFETIGFCEINERCRTFLERTWRIFCERDIRCLDARRYRGRLTILTGGPPCQPSSRTGNQRGAADDRWLWPEALRVLDEAQPDWVVFENPLGILDMDFDGILSQMERSGYEVQTFDIPACAVDSPQLRHRLWIVGHSNGEPGPAGETKPIQRGAHEATRLASNVGISDLADSNCKRWDGRSGESGPAGWREPSNNPWEDAVWTPCLDGKFRRTPNQLVGVVNGVHRSLLTALGNSIVPQVAYQILKAITMTIRGSKKG